MERFSVALNNLDMQMVKSEEYDDKKVTVEKQLEQTMLQAASILTLLLGNQEFIQTFLCNRFEELHLFTHASKRLIILDVLTRCAVDQVANFDTYKFTAHPVFEKKISLYTRSTDKPNLPLSKCRAWDVALNVIVKVEALDPSHAMLPNSRLLFREYAIMKYIWESYMRENMELDEMTGIPMVFEYTEVPNPEFNYELNVEYKVIDIFGSLIPWKSDNFTTLSYMSMEKLGPSIKFLQELMIVSKRKSRTFDLDTSFKIFDQLICRCLQLHRFGVVHNSVEPRNVYFGRSIGFNVVHICNFSKSMIQDSKDRKVSDTFLGGDPRYVSHMRVRGSPPLPIQDIESSFYTLLSMILCSLPWDNYLQQPRNSTPRTSDNIFNLNLNTSNQVQTEDLEHQPKVREMKSNFWKAPNGINRVLADMRYLTTGEEYAHLDLAIEIIKELYGRLRDQIQSAVGSKRSAIGSLMTPQSSEYQFYMELRRVVLMFFRFESLSITLCTPTYQKKLETLARDEHEPRPAWNISNWCFNAVQMRGAGDMRQSITAMARTK